MDTIWLVYGIIALLILFILTIVLLVIYSGIFQNVQVGAGKPPIGEVYVAYKYGQGPYKNAGTFFNETYSLVPSLKNFGVYYDDPNQVSENKLRYAVGAILAEGHAKPDEASENLLKKNGFKIAKFPSVDNAVKATFPFNTTLSIFIAIARVYPVLNKYIKEQKLCAHPVLEIYDGNTIYFMMPLSKQDDFYVAETLEVVEPGTKNETDDTLSQQILEGEQGQGDRAIKRKNDNTLSISTLSGDSELSQAEDKKSDGESEHSTGSSFEQIEEDEFGNNSL